MVQVEKRRHFTRRSGVELIRETFGVEVPVSRFEKDAMDGRAPAPVAVYGRTHLYTEEQILAYGESLIQPIAPQNAAGDKSTSASRDLQLCGGRGSDKGVGGRGPPIPRAN
jgi:hypothetical protein